MTLARIIRLTELLSIMLIVFGFGLRSSGRDATALIRHPRLLARSLLAMNILLPLFAACIVELFALRPGALVALHPAIAIALIALAVSPVPPILPGQQLKLVAHAEFIFGLFGATSLFAILLAPLTVALLAAVFTQQVHIEPSAVATTVALTVLVPFSLGMLARHTMLKFAARASSLSNEVGSWLLVLALVPVLINQWPAMISLIGNGTVYAFVAFTAVGLAVGHVLGGPDTDNRTVLALATASRHPGVALTIATEMYPDQKLVAPALLLYLIVGAITSAPYVMWRRRLHNRRAPAT